jgi:hypothetical protein
MHRMIVWNVRMNIGKATAWRWFPTSIEIELLSSSILVSSSGQERPDSCSHSVYVLLSDANHDIELCVVRIVPQIRIHENMSRSAHCYRLVDKYMSSLTRWDLELAFHGSLSPEYGPFGKLIRSNQFRAYDWRYNYFSILYHKIR